MPVFTPSSGHRKEKPAKPHNSSTKQTLEKISKLSVKSTIDSSREKAFFSRNQERKEISENSEKFAKNLRKYTDKPPRYASTSPSSSTRCFQ
jgi:hypothetical protein